MPEIWTYSDVMEHLTDDVEPDSVQRVQRMLRRAIAEVYRDLPKVHNWSYYLTRGRIVTNAAQSTGTIFYDHTGGTYSRMVVLSGATWPSWAAEGTIYINNVAYEVDERKSNTQITLKTTSNPAADVASGTAYLLYRDTYTLPDGFGSMQRLFELQTGRQIDYVAPTEWLGLQYPPSPGMPSRFTVTGSPDSFGSMSIRFAPPPKDQVAYDFIYRRRPQPLSVESHRLGQVVVFSGNPQITGVDTNWNSSMVGSVIRLSATMGEPTGPYGVRPYTYQRFITSVTNATTLDIDSAINQIVAGSYEISSPIDVDNEVMLSAFLRGCECANGLITDRKQVELRKARYEEALRLAMEADDRYVGDRASSAYGQLPYLNYSVQM